MNRVSFFIDGFNLYHSLKDNAPDCRWLNLRKLCEHYIDPSKEVIGSIYYFSAIANWHPDVTKAQKHSLYIERLRKENVIPILGKFKEKDIHCKECGRSFKSHEEKRTDVNIALKIVSEAVLNSYDTGILVSGDTDMIPAIETVRNLALNKRIGVLFPLRRFSNELKEIADFNLRIKRDILLDSLFESDTAPQGWVPEKAD
jgi:uncharacterized LabA/DUF88 family protein